MKAIRVKKSNLKERTDLRPVLMKSGYCISKWSRNNGYNRRTVEYALKGESFGKLSREIRAKVEKLTV